MTPRIKPARNENTPIGWLSRRGGGCGIATRRIVDLLIDNAALLVVVADSGETFALNPHGNLATDALEKRPAWVVGTYATGAERARIVADLEARAAELKAVAA